MQLMQYLRDAVPSSFHPTNGTEIYSHVLALQLSDSFSSWKIREAQVDGRVSVRNARSVRVIEPNQTAVHKD